MILIKVLFWVPPKIRTTPLFYFGTAPLGKQRYYSYSNNFCQTNFMLQQPLPLSCHSSHLFFTGHLSCQSPEDGVALPVSSHQDIKNDSCSQTLTDSNPAQERNTQGTSHQQHQFLRFDTMNYHQHQKSHG